MNQLLLASEVIAARQFSLLYVILDTAFLVALCVLLFVTKRRLTLLFGLFGGVLYFVVDYGIFHLLTGSRSISFTNVAGEVGTSEALMFWILLWMSMSYGITNFVLLWVWMGKDRHMTEWTLLIFVWWICAPMISSSFGADLGTVSIARTTGAYHGYMALIMLASYLAAIGYNLFQSQKEKRIPLLRLFFLGVSVQFAWEMALLIGGIRSPGFGLAQIVNTFVVNSLLETNLGAVPIFAIYVWITSRFTEDAKKRPNAVRFSDRIEEINLIKRK